MGGPADRRINGPAKRGLRHRRRAAPSIGIGLAVERSIAGEGELTPRRARRALINHAADAGRKRWMPNPVEHDLGNCALAVHILVAGLVINGAREAVEGLCACGGDAFELERRGSWIGAGDDRDFGV